jgi:hypothetical protein
MPGIVGTIAGKLVTVAGDHLLDRTADAILGGKGQPTRSTLVYVNNHTSREFFVVRTEFGSGGLSPGAELGKVEERSRHAYRVESHGFMTGVTDATVVFAFDPRAKAKLPRPHDRDPKITGDNLAFAIVTSNPFMGDNSAKVWSLSPKLVVRSTKSVGTNNVVSVYVEDAAPTPTRGTKSNGKKVPRTGSQKKPARRRT